MRRSSADCFRGLPRQSKGSGRFVPYAGCVDAISKNRIREKGICAVAVAAVPMLFFIYIHFTHLLLNQDSSK